MNAQQVKWASQHDWYVGQHKTESPGQYVVVVESVEIQDGQPVKVRDTFGGYEALREWAGY